MRRMILILMVAAMLVAMSATPAFAADSGHLTLNMAGSSQPVEAESEFQAGEDQLSVSGEAEEAQLSGTINVYFHVIPRGTT
jgi:hypothetical protein